MKGLMQAVKRRMHKDDKDPSFRNSVGTYPSGGSSNKSPTGRNSGEGGNPQYSDNNSSAGTPSPKSSGPLPVMTNPTGPFSATANAAVPPGPTYPHGTAEPRTGSPANLRQGSPIARSGSGGVGPSPGHQTLLSSGGDSVDDGRTTAAAMLAKSAHGPSLASRLEPRAGSSGGSVDIDGIFNRPPHSTNSDVGKNSESSNSSPVLNPRGSEGLREGGSWGVTYPPGFTCEGNPFDGVALLRDTAQNKRLELFRKKLQICSIIYDFTMPEAFVKEKEAKRQTLCELVDYVNSAMICFNDHIMSDIINMVASNIFRTLPNYTSTNTNASAMYEPEEDEPRLESAWPHLQIVYELFRRFIVSPDTDAKLAKRYIEQTFILKILRLFASEDPRERDYLKTILHRIYGKIMAMRSFIRKSIQHIFFETVYENEIQYGTAELLEILGSIVNGFALPLKEEHKLFLEKSLLPLHKARNFVCYHQFLSYCMQQYVEKDSRLGETIILGLMKYWPMTNTNKEVLFIGEVEEILELTQMAEFQRIMVPLFRRVAECIQSSHFQVAERVLFLWNNDHIVKLINENRQELFPIVIQALSQNAKEHWNSTVNSLTYSVSKLLNNSDPALFDHCNETAAYAAQRTQQRNEERELFWNELKARDATREAACLKANGPKQQRNGMPDPTGLRSAEDSGSKVQNK